MKVEQLHGPRVKSFQVLELEYLLQEDSPDLFFSFGLQKGGQVIVTRAPARLDIMGGIADYCGANVFEMTLNRTAIAACQAREDRNLCAITLHAGVNSNPTFISRWIVSIRMARSKRIHRFRNVSAKNREPNGRDIYSVLFMCFSKKEGLINFRTVRQSLSKAIFR